MPFSFSFYASYASSTRLSVVYVAAGMRHALLLAVVYSNAIIN